MATRILNGIQILILYQLWKGSGGLMENPHMGHDHDSSYDTSTGWLQEADSRVI